MSLFFVAVGAGMTNQQVHTPYSPGLVPGGHGSTRCPSGASARACPRQRKFAAGSPKPGQQRK